MNNKMATRLKSYNFTLKQSGAESKKTHDMNCKKIENKKNIETNIFVRLHQSYNVHV